MITEDDSRTTLQLDDRYIIEPAFAWWSRESYLTIGARRVEEGFRYSSESNTEWLDKEGLDRLLEENGSA